MPAASAVAQGLSVGKDTVAGTSALYPAANCLLQTRGGLKKAGYGIRGDWGKKGDNGSKDGSEKRPPCRCADLSLDFQISRWVLRVGERNQVTP